MGANGYLEHSFRQHRDLISGALFMAQDGVCSASATSVLTSSLTASPIKIGGFWVSLGEGWKWRISRYSVTFHTLATVNGVQEVESSNLSTQTTKNPPGNRGFFIASPIICPVYDPVLSALTASVDSICSRKKFAVLFQPLFCNTDDTNPSIRSVLSFCRSSLSLV